MTEKAEDDLRDSRTWKRRVGCGTIYITITEMNGRFRDLFCNLGKAGSCTICWSHGLSRIISKAVSEYGMPLESVIKQIQGAECPAPLSVPKPGAKSCPDVIAQVLEIWLFEHIKKTGEEE